MPRRRRVSHSEPDAEKQGNTNVTPAIISLDSLERITTTPVHSWKDCAWKYHQPAGLSIDVNMAETGGWGRDGVKHWQALSEFRAVQSWFWDVLLSICTTGSMRVDRDVMWCLYNKHLRTMGNKFCSWLILKKLPPPVRLLATCFINISQIYLQRVCSLQCWFAGESL